MVVCGVENKMRKCDTLLVKQKLQERGIHYGHNYVQNAIKPGPKEMTSHVTISRAPSEFVT